ncbi:MULTISPECIES: fasciclin domain-containing protein [Mesoflavibacter]|nr:beta-Ig-H3/fasciclin [Mesoflavibacter sp. HG96]QIJ92608.1 beta-Ig-H3/fasciclin [Mesoflavibacter sp. HG37]
MKKKNLFKSILALTVMLSSSIMFAQNSMEKEDTKMVGGAAMYPSKNIVENAVNSKDHTTLVAAVKAAELVDVLQSEGPFTVFAPTNAAFDKLPEGTVATLVKPENKATLQTILKYHVVAGKWNAKAIAKLIKDGKGKAMIKTVSGGTLTAWTKGDNVYVTDENGNSAMVTIADVNQSNGVIHVIDTVLLPKS